MNCVDLLNSNSQRDRASRVWGWTSASLLRLRPNSSARRWRIAHSEASTGWGGQEHRILAELTGFRRRGHEVWLLAPVQAQITDRARVAGIGGFPFSLSKWLYPFTAGRIARWLRRRRIDIVNTHSSRDGWVIGLAARLARIPLLLRSRHIEVDYPNRWISRHAFVTLADHVLTTSLHIATRFSTDLGLTAYHVTSLPTGVDLDRFSPSVLPARLVPQVNPALPLIGMVSVLRSWKGHETFIRAASILRTKRFPAHFVIAGSGPALARIRALIDQEQMNSHVTLLGHREDVPAVLRALSLLIIPSLKHEGVPQIGLQAMAVKTPVIGSDVGGIPEIIRPGETGRLFPRGCASDTAACIRDALSDKATTAAMVEHARAEVVAHHGLEQMLDQLEHLYTREFNQARVY